MGAVAGEVLLTLNLKNLDYCFSRAGNISTILFSSYAFSLVIMNLCNSNRNYN